MAGKGGGYSLGRKARTTHPEQGERVPWGWVSSSSHPHASEVSTESALEQRRPTESHLVCPFSKHNHDRVSLSRRQADPRKKQMPASPASSSGVGATFSHLCFRPRAAWRSQPENTSSANGARGPEAVWRAETASSGGRCRAPGVPQAAAPRRSEVVS